MKKHNLSALCKKATTMLLAFTTTCSLFSGSAITWQTTAKAATYNEVATYATYCEPFTTDADRDGSEETVWSCFQYGEIGRAHV